jgi:hypothetical protein
MPPDSSASTRPELPTGKPPGPGSFSNEKQIRSRRTSTNTVSSGRSRSTRTPVAMWTAAPTARSISTEFCGNVLSARFVVTRKDPNASGLTASAAARPSASRSRGASCTREKFATPKTPAIRSRALSHATPSGSVIERRPGSARTVTPPRSPHARRRFSASLSTKNGRLPPLSAISW